MYIACEKCKYNYDGECDFYDMGSGNEVDMPCYQEEELIGEAADNFLQAFVGVDINEVESKIIKTEETQESGVKYLNINVSSSEVERNPDIVRLCSDAGILEYMKPKTGRWILQPSNKEQGERDFIWWKCSRCGQVIFSETEKDRREFQAFCSRCGAKMVDSQKRE